MSQLRAFLVPFLMVTSIMAALVTGVHYAVNASVIKSTKQEAAQKARQWIVYFSNNIPNIENLIETGDPSVKQMELIQNAVAFGDVFRFKLFRPDGTIATISDEMQFRAEKGSAWSKINKKAIAVFKTGVANISVNDGTKKPDRPDLYVEAYVRAFAPDGKVIGVLEIYVDQTASASIIKINFSKLEVLLPLLCAIAYLIPSLLYVRRNEQARQAEVAVRKLSEFDTLTGVFNRRAFSLRLEEAFDLREEFSSGIGVIFIDVDDFKIINDENGHAGGDAFLRHVAHKISHNIRESDIVGRFGGDEFVIGLPDIDHHELIAIARRVLAEVSLPLDHDGRTISGGLSLGVYLSCGKQTTDAALRAADLALYHAKETGKGSMVEYFEGMERAMIERRVLEKKLRHALKESLFELNYQPLTDPDTKQILGFEALLRLPDDGDNYVGPDVFVPVAEEIGLINEIGAWTLNEAIATACEWPEPLFISINLSAKQFETGDLVDTIRNALSSSRFRAQRLELEVTESLLISDSAMVEEQINQLKSMGISIAMDDFGTGYSSLGYLWKYGFDKLKIDRSFLEGFNVDATRQKDIIETIVMLGHKMGMKVTAEGVENSEQHSILTELKCDQLQGFLFGRPMSASDAALAIKNCNEANKKAMEEKQPDSEVA